MTSSEYPSSSPGGEKLIAESPKRSDSANTDAKLVAQAIVFGSLTVSGSGLFALTATSGVDSFYPIFGFAVAVYIAWRRFF